MQQEHFDKIFRFLSIMAYTAVIYVFAITFLPIPKDNVRFADTTQGFFLGTIIGGIIAFFCSGSPPVIKKPDEQKAGTTTANISATVTQSNDTNDAEPQQK